MNKLDSKPAALTFSIASHSDPHPIRRLIVPVPESEADSAIAAQKIWELANVLRCRVQFIGLCKDETREPSLRRQIVLLSAMVRDSNVSVESKIEFGSNWLKVVRCNWRDGDVIACFAEQQTGFTPRPLSQILESNLNAKVYVLSDSQYRERSPSNWALSVMGWVGSIGIIAGFFWMQVEITQLPEDWVHTSLLYLSIPIEVALIWGWNTLFP